MFERPAMDEVFVARADGSAVLNLTSSPANEEMPAWSPDGGMVAFSSSRDGVAEIYLIAPDGTGLRRLVPPDETFGGSYLGSETAWRPAR